MTNIADLLDATTQARLAAVTADLDASAPAKVHNHSFDAKTLACECGGRIEGRRYLPPTKPGEPGIVVTKASTDPNPPRPLTKADAIEIDPESEALIDALCVDCKAPVLIDPQMPKGVDPEALRVPICKECAKVRARFAALSEQRNVEVIKRKQVARHQPRITDGIDHPVEVKHKTKESAMQTVNVAGLDIHLFTDEPAKDEPAGSPTDLSEMSNAELGALMKEQMCLAKTKDVKVKAKKAKKAKAQKEAKAVEGVKVEQERRKGHVLEGFMVGTTLEVPTLDLSDVSSLDEAPSAKERSPYNKARFRLTKEAPLDPEETTYRVLEQEHMRLKSLVADANEAHAEAKPKKAKKKAKAEVVEAPAIVAVLDEDVKAKAKALAKVAGISKKQALKILVG